MCKQPVEPMALQESSRRALQCVQFSGEGRDQSDSAFVDGCSLHSRAVPPELPTLCFCVFSASFPDPQFEGSESLSSTNLCQRSRPSSDLNNSSTQSPAHSKVQRSISANQKQRRFSDHGEAIFDWLNASRTSPSIPNNLSQPSF